MYVLHDVHEIVESYTYIYLLTLVCLKISLTSRKYHPHRRCIYQKIVRSDFHLHIIMKNDMIDMYANFLNIGMFSL